MPGDPRDQRVQQHHQRNEENHDACIGDQPKGLDGEAGDAVDGKGQHFFEGIFAFSGEALAALVKHGVALEAYHGRQSPQEQIDLLELGQRVQGPVAHQPVVRVVEDDVHPHAAHQPVEHQRSFPLEEGVLFPFAAHTVDDFAALAVLLDELVHGVHVVLQIRIHGNADVAAVPGRHQPGQQRVLVAPVPAQLHALEQGIFLVQAGNQLPCAVLAAVVYQQHLAVLGDEPLFHQAAHFDHQPPGRFRQHFFFIITGNDDHQFFRHGEASLSG